MKNPFVICLMGPTCSGKTDLAIELTQHLPCEIISVDSAMVYRDMNIGTAKPSQEILTATPHHLIDIRDPADSYSVGQFRDDAAEKIQTILAQGKIPLLVGGTMLYFNVLQRGLDDLPKANPAIREQLEHEVITHGLPALHKRLQKIDPIAAARIHPNDPQRIQRALEIYAITGKTMSAIQQENKTRQTFYTGINIALAPQDREQLHTNIAKRFEQMLQQGFIEEVEKLFQRKDLHPDLPSIRAVGYRQIWDYLAGNASYTEMKERGIAATRQLAKRQFTWLRSWEDLYWFASEEKNTSEKILQLLNLRSQ